MSLWRGKIFEKMKTNIFGDIHMPISFIAPSVPSFIQLWLATNDPLPATRPLLVLCPEGHGHARKEG